VTASPPCSVLAAHEPLAGTAPHARGWLVIEHPGPYPRVATDALGELAEPLRTLCREGGVAPLLARRPRAAGRRVWLAIDGRMVTWSHIDAVDLLSVDWESVAAGGVPRGAATSIDPILFICTNGKRDACCAQFGRPVADALMHDHDDVLECSHIGGHRLAPTALLLPFGSVHGRLTAISGAQLLAGAQAGRLRVESLRGLTHLPADQQVADAAVRDVGGLDSFVRLEVTSTGDDTRRDCVVETPDGRRWQVRLVRSSGAPRPESCGKEPVPPEWWRVDSIGRA